MMASDRIRKNGITARYFETPSDRIVTFELEDRTAAIIQNQSGYAMLSVRPGPDEPELERYYGFSMALDHVAELLTVDPAEIPVPNAAADMGM